MSDPASAVPDGSDSAVKSQVQPAASDIEPATSAGGEVTREYGPTVVGNGFELPPELVQFTDHDLEPAPRQLGKYSIECRIGRGGMGVVWKAHDPDLNRTVAIKVLGAHLAHSRTARQRFLREARAAAAISHPNVLTIHAVEEQDHAPFIVMEYVPGGSLKDYVIQRGRLAPIQAIQLGYQIAQGLAAAHAQGVIHRDVKPGNVMLHEGVMRVRLADFGLARVAFDNAELTSHDQTVGTPAYVAPEQLRGDRVDARADLFSLGCVLHFMLVGYSPFVGRTQAETIHMVLTEAHRPLLQIDSAIPPVLVEVIDRLLSKSPDGRYQSAAEVAAILERYLILLNQAPTDKVNEILARPVGSDASDRPARGARRRRIQMVAGAAAAILAVGTGSVLFWDDPLADRLSSESGSPAPGDDASSRALSVQNLVPEVPRQPRVLTVARGEGPAEFRTLDEAIGAALPGDTVRVMDSATYEVNLVLRKVRGLLLESTAGAQLVTANPDEHVIRADGAQDLQIRGFSIRTEQNNHAVLLSGCNGVQLENLTITQQGAQANAAIQLQDCNTSPSAAPLLIRRCRVITQSSGQCLWVLAESQPTWNVLIERNLFRAEGDDKGTLVALFVQAGSTILIENNVFDQCVNGINLELRPADDVPAGDNPTVRIVNNAFGGCQWWFGLMGTDPSATPFVLANNLILNCDAVQTWKPNQLRDAVTACTLSGNLWERGPLQPGEPAELQSWARFEPSVTVESRNPADAGYLRLPADSPLHAVAAGGDSPARVGVQP